ncbi:MAG: M24 family metallopeptidase, partial [Gemmatimonadota bacterium]
GFTGSAGILLVSATEVVLISDFRYSVQATQEAGTVARVEIDRVSIWDRLRRFLADMDLETLGYESHVATIRDVERLAGVRARLVPSADLVERLRASKTPEEIAAIRAAAALAEAALAETLPDIHPGQNEFAIAALLERALRRRGSEWHPFPTIVASGPRSALPHARTSDRTVVPGDWLLLDFGAMVDGYCADLTRTYVVGAAPDPRQRATYAIVRAAQERACEFMRAGMTGRQVDALARDLIVERGFGDAFGHSLGHGLGLEVHEAPRLSALAEEPLPRHAVVTVEPGIYFPGWGGVRLEEDVHLDLDGAELLSSGPTDLIELR